MDSICVPVDESFSSVSAGSDFSSHDVEVFSLLFVVADVLSSTPSLLGMESSEPAFNLLRSAISSAESGCVFRREFCLLFWNHIYTDKH